MKRSFKVEFATVHPNAAGIDVGSRSHWVCVGDQPWDQPEDVREFGVFTDSLHQMARWLKNREVQTIAMESTGFYWKNLFLLSSICLTSF